MYLSEIPGKLNWEFGRGILPQAVCAEIVSYVYYNYSVYAIYKLETLS